MLFDGSGGDALEAIDARSLQRVDEVAGAVGEEVVRLPATADRGDRGGVARRGSRCGCGVEGVDRRHGEACRVRGGGDEVGEGVWVANGGRDGAVGREGLLDDKTSGAAIGAVDDEVGHESGAPSGGAVRTGR